MTVITTQTCRTVDGVGAGRHKAKLAELGSRDDDGGRADCQHGQLSTVRDETGVQLVLVRAGRVERVLTDDEVAADSDQRQHEQQQTDEQASVCLYTQRTLGLRTLITRPIKPRPRRDPRRTTAARDDKQTPVRLSGNLNYTQ